MSEENPPSSDAGDRDTEWTLPNVRKPVPELVSDRVAEFVTNGELAPGDRLPTEPEIARRFGVARSSVRTGLQRLQARGLVEVNRGRGWYVLDAGADEPDLPEDADADAVEDPAGDGDYDILDVLEVRIALEGAAAALAAARSTGEKSRFDEIAKRSRDHRDARHDDPEELLETDKAFHRAVVRAAGNAYLTAVYDSLVPRVEAWRRRTFTSPEVHDRSATEHDQIAFQLRRGDEVGARMTMTGHLLGHYRSLLRERAAERGVEASFSAFVDASDKPEWSDR